MIPHRDEAAGRQVKRPFVGIGFKCALIEAMAGGYQIKMAASLVRIRRLPRRCEGGREPKYAARYSEPIDMGLTCSEIDAMVGGYGLEWHIMAPELSASL